MLCCLKIQAKNRNIFTTRIQNLHVHNLPQTSCQTNGKKAKKRFISICVCIILHVTSFFQFLQQLVALQ